MKNSPDQPNKDIVERKVSRVEELEKMKQDIDQHSACSTCGYIQRDTAQMQHDAFKLYQSFSALIENQQKLIKLLLANQSSSP
jgi:hypothetical protein